MGVMSWRRSYLLSWALQRMSGGRLTRATARELVSSPAQILGLAENDVLAYAYNDILYIKNPGKQIRLFQLYNLHGQLMLKREVQSNIELDVRDLNNGIYLLFDGAKTHKILLK